MAVARIVVTVFLPGQENGLHAWRLHATQVVGSAMPERSASAADKSVWHIVSPNNRILARRIAVFDSAALALADARAGLEESGEYRAALVRDGAHRKLGWYLRRDEQPALVSARWYASERDRRKSIASTLEALGEAIVDATPRTARYDLPRVRSVR